MLTLHRDEPLDVADYALWTDMYFKVSMAKRLYIIYVTRLVWLKNKNQKIKTILPHKRLLTRIKGKLNPPNKTLRYGDCKSNVRYRDNDEMTDKTFSRFIPVFMRKILCTRYLYPVAITPRRVPSRDMQMSFLIATLR